MRRKVHPGILKRYEFVWIWHHQQQKKKLLQNILTRFWELQVCKIDSLNSKNSKKTAPSFFPLSNLTLSSLSRRNLRLNLLVWMLNTWIQLGLNPFCLPLATSLDSLLTGSLLPQSQAACYVLNSWPSTIHQFKSACCLFWDPPLHQNTHGAVVDVWTLLSKVVC